MSRCEPRRWRTAFRLGPYETPRWRLSVRLARHRLEIDYAYGEERETDYRPRADRRRCADDPRGNRRGSEPRRPTENTRACCGLLRGVDRGHVDRSEGAHRSSPRGFT